MEDIRSGPGPSNSTWKSWLNTRQAATFAACAVPIFFGVYSVFLGADTNWDLFNYHLYTPFALLHGKLEVDLAAGGFQGYFNPLIDLPAYFLNTSLPPRLAGFLLGVLHGLVFPLVLVIARCILSDLPSKDALRIPLLISAAACLTPNFLSAVGNGMGDNMTALPTLAALAILLSNWRIVTRPDLRGLSILLVSGLLIGMAVGLKPTNGGFAVAGCGALLLTLPEHVAVRLRTSFVLGCGILSGFALTGGYWMMRLWEGFRNPLFPQFSSVFPHPLTTSLSVGDTRWLPQGALEFVLWPFLFSIDPHRVGELSIHQFIWPLAYALMLVWLARSAWQAFQGRSAVTDSRCAFLLTFIALGYIVWMGLFSIMRYAVVIEVLLPLTIFVLLTKWQPYQRAKTLTGWLFCASTIYMIVAGLPNWGHQDWTAPLYHAETPYIGSPEHTTVLLVIAPGERPLGWLATFFSPDLSFVGLENTFPASAGFAGDLQSRVALRGGPVYVMTNAPVDRAALKMASYDALATQFGLTQSDAGCASLRFLVEKLHFRALVESAPPSVSACRLAVLPEKHEDISALRQAYIAHTKQALQHNGFSLEESSCKTYAAGIGAGVYDYQFCAVTRVVNAAS